MPVALGIDFEHIEHTPAYRSLDGAVDVSLDLWSITNGLLDLFDEYGATATFFFVSELAEENPEMVRLIESRGHEIASHTVSHRSLVDLDSADRRHEIATSKDQLESITETPVTGFRAPTCRIDDGCYRLLSQEGYEYSSTVMPSIPIPGFYSAEQTFSSPRPIDTATGPIMELPLTVSPLVRLPISGAWIRLLGRRYLLYSVRERLRRGHPILTYSHPWEFTSISDTRLPRRTRIRTGSWLFETYERLLSIDAEFVPVSQLME
jgi:peptidoglycan/xylan/chitin deacetylase (PgdA/CDA1 family)